MKRLMGIALLAMIPVMAVAADDKHPDWAFPVRDPNFKPMPKPDDGQPHTVPGSMVSFTKAQLADAGHVFADWFPDDHPPAPAIVATGVGMARACATCHTPAGVGHPESANLAGLTPDYMLRQLTAFKDGTRQNNAMATYAKAMSDDDAHAAVSYFAVLPAKPWTKIVEAAMVPKSAVGVGNLRVPVEDGGMEPLGKRIIELPDDEFRTEQLRDPHSGFTAYVPKGSVNKGKTLVTTGGGGKTTPCSICHGDGLKGLANVPRIAGHSPVQIAREIYLIKLGERTDKDSELMKPVVAKLTDDDIINIAAYVGSLNPL